MTDQTRDVVTRGQSVLLACASLFVACLVLSATTAVKLYDIGIGSFAVAVPVGTTLYALSFLASDVVNEVWGPRHALAMVVLGFLMRIGTFLFLGFAVSVDATTGWSGQAAYAQVLQSADSVLWAGIVAFVFSQPLNIMIYDRLRRLQRGRDRLWLRATLAALVAQSVDTVIFVMLAFGTDHSSELAAIVIGQILVKLAVAIATAPLLYVGRNAATGRPLLDIAG